MLRIVISLGSTNCELSVSASWYVQVRGMDRAAKRAPLAFSYFRAQPSPLPSSAELSTSSTHTTKYQAVHFTIRLPTYIISSYTHDLTNFSQTQSHNLNWIISTRQSQQRRLNTSPTPQLRTLPTMNLFQNVPLSRSSLLRPKPKFFSTSRPSCPPNPSSVLTQTTSPYVPASCCRASPHAQ